MKTPTNLNSSLARLFISITTPQLVNTQLPVAQFESLEPYHRYYFQAIYQLNANICDALLEHENTCLANKILKVNEWQQQQSETEESIIDWNMVLESTITNLGLLVPILRD